MNVISEVKDTRNLGNLGGNIRRFRAQKGLTIEAFASLIERSTRIIYDYEDGFKCPTLETLVRIANVLDVSIDSILS